MKIGEIGISLAPQSGVPATVRSSKYAPLSRGGLGGAAPQHCQRIVSRVWIQFV